MRMDPDRGLSAQQWLAQADERDIARALKDYGEERFAVPIAQTIAARFRRDGPGALARTLELAALVAGVVRRRQTRPEAGKDPATRTFQALRILVNQELEELPLVLEQALGRLRPGGRLVVMAFHSIEDRVVKQFMAHEAGAHAPRDPITGAPVPAAPPRLRLISRTLPDEAEVSANPRARSVVLRIAERC
jgi:16S rRNA (cytosine1402-N4)-methyltransferase